MADVSGLDRLVEIMRQLRDPVTGCAWDREQSFESIAPYTIEEAYEVADAIGRGDMTALVDELGDLQLQVVFHAAIARDAGFFDLDDVMAAICAKLVRRHPHVFAGEPNPGWDTIKAAERRIATDTSALADIPRAAPALSRAQKMSARAARIGFDWPNAAGARAKVGEELREIDEADDLATRTEEIGDLLLATVNLARKLGIDAEAALRAATDKFERRFRHMELADPHLATRSLAEQEALWKDAKRSDSASAVSPPGS